MLLRKGTALFTALCLVMLMAAPAFARSQTTGRIAGNVKDASGAVMVGADVIVTNTTTGEERKVATDEAGNYIVPLLPPGAYQVTVAARGFKKAIYDGVRVAITETTAVNAELVVGAVTEEAVTITAGA